MLKTSVYVRHMPQDDTTPDDSFPLDWDEEEEEEFDEAWARVDQDAVELLRGALPEIVEEDPPSGALAAAADRLRTGMTERSWPFDHMRKAAGLGPRSLPKHNLELWLGAAGGYISMRDESGMGIEEEATLASLEHADWLGAVIGLVRAGVGARAEPDDLLRYANSCPEIEGEIDFDDEDMVETGYEMILTPWEVAGALDELRHLTALGRWGLPRALAWAWNGDFDATPPDDGD